MGVLDARVDSFAGSGKGGFALPSPMEGGVSPLTVDPTNVLPRDGAVSRTEGVLVCSPRNAHKL